MHLELARRASLMNFQSVHGNLCGQVRVIGAGHLDFVRVFRVRNALEGNEDLHEEPPEDELTPNGVRIAIQFMAVGSPARCVNR